MIEIRRYSCINCSAIISEEREEDFYAISGGKLFLNRPDIPWEPTTADSPVAPPIGGICSHTLTLNHLISRLAPYIAFTSEEEYKKTRDSTKALEESVDKLRKFVGQT